MSEFIFDLIPDIEIYAICALVVFMSIFFIVIIWTLRLDKKYIDEMEQLPLDSTDINGEYQND